MFTTCLKGNATASEEWTGHGVPDDTDVIVLHRFFDKHADKIGKELLSLSKPSPESDASAINGKRAWDGLCALLVDLGTPSEIPRPSTQPTESHAEYQELLEECAQCDMSSVKGLFVEVDTQPVRPLLVHHSYQHLTTIFSTRTLFLC